MHRKRNMQPITPKILIIRHSTFPLIRILAQQFLHITIALIFQIAQMPRRLEPLRCSQDLVEQRIGVEDEHRSLWVRGAESAGEVGEADVPGGDGSSEGRGAVVVWSKLEGGYV